MAKSSIHIKVGNVNFVIHSTRNNFSYSVVFTDEKNEHLHDAKTALKIYREELAKRALAYTQATGQKLQKNVATILSAVVNLEQHHTLQDLEPILKKLEKDLDTKIISASIHRDEGTLIEKSSGKKFFSGEDFALNRQDGKLYWIDDQKNFLELINMEQYEVKKNYHAHVEFMGIDSNGRAIKRNRLNRYYLSTLQDFVAETLGMERGKRLSKAKHKDPHEFKREGVAKRQAQAELEKKATIKALKEINKQIRAQLKEKHAQRPHYAKWESYYKELQQYVKSEKPTMNKVVERIGDFIGDLLQEIENANKQNQDLLQRNRLLQEQLHPKLEPKPTKKKEEEEQSREEEIKKKLQKELEELKKWQREIREHFKEIKAIWGEIKENEHIIENPQSGMEEIKALRAKPKLFEKMDKILNRPLDTQEPKIEITETTQEKTKNKEHTKNSDYDLDIGL